MNKSSSQYLGIATCDVCPWLSPGTDRWVSDLREAAFPHPFVPSVQIWLSPVTCHVTPVEPSGLHYPERASANAGEDLNPREPLVGMGNGCAPGRPVPVRLPQDNTLPRRKGVVGGKKRRGGPFFLVRSCFSKLRSLDGHLKCVRAVLLSRCRSAGSSSLSDVPDDL